MRAARGAEALDQRIRHALAEAEAEDRIPVRVIDCLPVIVDMSFAGRRDTPDPAATRENPLADGPLSWDAESWPAIPSVNLGPWGEDYHTPYERADIAYTFGGLPRVLNRIVRAVLRKPEDQTT